VVKVRPRRRNSYPGKYFSAFSLMSMGTRKDRERQEDLWITHSELAAAPSHPFYEKLNQF
jgi:hypothetical protein